MIFTQQGIKNKFLKVVTQNKRKPYVSKSPATKYQINKEYQFVFCFVILNIMVESCTYASIISQDVMLETSAFME